MLVLIWPVPLMPPDAAARDAGADSADAADAAARDAGADSDDAADAAAHDADLRASLPVPSSPSRRRLRCPRDNCFV